MTARAGVVGGAPELRRLASAFDDTATRLEALMAAQDEFVADASHQLRSPLTAVRLCLEGIEQEADGALRHEAGFALHEVDRLSRNMTVCLSWREQTPPARAFRPFV